MQHDQQYPRTTTDKPIVKAGNTFGFVLAWALIALVGVVIASGLLALIVALWRVIL